jgi:hypothetical protein
MAETLIRRAAPDQKDDDLNFGLIYDDTLGLIVGFYGQNNTEDRVNVSYALGALTERFSLLPNTATRQRVNLAGSRRISCRPATVADHPWQQQSGWVLGGNVTVERVFGTPRRGSPSILSAAYTEFFSSATTSHAVPMPATVDSNDGLLVGFYVASTANCWAPGFSQLADGTNTNRLYAFGKVAAGTEDGTTVDFQTTSTAFAIAHVYRVDAGTWAEVVSGFEATVSTGTSATPDPPAVTPTWGSNDMTVVPFVGKETGTVTSAPTSYTDLVNGSGGDNMGSARRSVTGTTENPGTFGGSTSAVYVAITVAIASETATLGEGKPYFVGEGVRFAGTGATAGVLPGGLAVDDLLMWTMETEGEDTDAEALPDSWVAVDGSGGSVASATDSAADRTRLTIGYIFYSGTPPDLTSTDPGDHHVGVITAWRGVNTTTPIHAQQSSSDATNDTAMSVTGLTTTLDDCLIVQVEANGDDNAVGGCVGWSSVANANLAAPAVRHAGCAGTSSGSDGSVGVWFGGLASQGATGTLTGTIGASEESASWTIALAPAGAATQALTGSLFGRAPTFFTGAVAPGSVDLAGSLFQNTPTFPTGAVTSTYPLTGTLFESDPTFNQGAVTVGAVDLAGSLFQKGPTFPTGTVTVGAVALTGSLFQKAPTFFVGVVGLDTGQAVTGELFTNTPSFPQGAITVGAVDLAGVLFAKAPTFPQGAITTTYPIAGILYENSPVFHSGTVEAGAVPLNGMLFQKAPTFFGGAVTVETILLAGVLFAKTPSFPTGTVATTYPLVGVLFERAPTFPTGFIAHQVEHGPNPGLVALADTGKNRAVITDENKGLAPLREED